MLRQMLFGVLTVTLVTTSLALGSPQAGAATYTGPVTIGCTAVTYSGQTVLDRDNTGHEREALEVHVFDGAGTLLLNASINRPLGTYPAGLGTFAFKTFVGSNPIKVNLVSLAGNKLNASLVNTTSANCDMLPRSFIRAAYTDFLGRLPTATEENTELYRFAFGQTRAQMATRLSTSTEYLTGLVNRFYLDTLGRTGDPLGVDYWVNQVRSGSKTLSLTGAGFYASNEYFRGLGGGTNDSWVRDLYQKLLKRTPEASGLEYWTNRARRTRTPVALSFYQSYESRRTRVIAVYSRFLGRSPDQQALYLQSLDLLTKGDIPLAAALAASDEYAQRATLRYP